MKTITNRKASFDYQISERMEAGLVLTGAEAKSVRNGHLTLQDAFVRLKDGEAWLFNAHIHPYQFADNQDYDPYRPKKLLLHKKELLKLKQKTEQKNLTIVPISCYNRLHQIKLEIGLAKGKKAFEKRESLKQKSLKKAIGKKLKY